MKKLFCLIVGLVFLNACASATGPKLTFEGRHTLRSESPTVVDAVATVRNTGTSVADVPTPVCPIRVVAYSTAERSEQPVWESGPEFCVSTLMILPPIRIAAGDSHDFTARAILPASLAGQRIFLSMEVPAGGSIPVGQIVVK